MATKNKNGMATLFQMEHSIQKEMLLPKETVDIKQETVPDEEKPKLESTTLWDYPTQSYGKKPKGNNKYAGVTPAFIIYNLIQRYTKEGEIVVDPMAGSGTTLDVCEEENRFCVGFDISPAHPKVIKADARQIPLLDSVADMVFIDSPYSDNIRYSNHPKCIGRISCEEERFYNELETVAKEILRILKPGKVMAWLIGDQWVKKRFTPVGFLLYQRLSKYFEPIDIVCVVRRGQTSNTGVWHYRAVKHNFFLRGFKYLFIMRKPYVKDKKQTKTGKAKWHNYERKPRKQ